MNSSRRVIEFSGTVFSNGFTGLEGRFGHRPSFFFGKVLASDDENDEFVVVPSLQRQRLSRN